MSHTSTTAISRCRLGLHCHHLCLIARRHAPCRSLMCNNLFLRIHPIVDDNAAIDEHLRAVPCGDGYSIAGTDGFSIEAAEYYQETEGGSKEVVQGKGAEGHGDEPCEMC